MWWMKQKDNQFEAESGRAVGEADDVPGAADGLQDRLECGRCCRHGVRLLPSSEHKPAL